MGSSFMKTLFHDEELFERLRNENFDAALVDLKGNNAWMPLLHMLEIPMISFSG